MPRETRPGMNGRGNGGFLKDGGDDEKAPSRRNETRLEYLSRFCLDIGGLFVISAVAAIKNR
jgi:hypothetical protein